MTLIIEENVRGNPSAQVNPTTQENDCNIIKETIKSSRSAASSSTPQRKSKQKRQICEVTIGTSPIGVPCIAQGITGNGQRAFRGIKYATFTKRFKRARVADLWEGTKECFKFGPPPPQAFCHFMQHITSLVGAPNPSKKILKNYEAECLTINIYQPDKVGTFPVFVFLHGGGFMFGSGSSVGYQRTNGHPLTYKDFVVVNISYRLGALGFMAIGDTNLGLWDQQCALQWIHQHISAFGGDPENIILCGESAGGMCVGLHCISPYSQKYFKRAIMMSGACSNAMPLEDALALGHRFMRSCGCSTIEELEKIDVHLITSKTFSFLVNEIGGHMPFQPVVDGDFIPQHPHQLMEKIDKPVLIGHNRDEFQLFMWKLPFEKYLMKEASLKNFLKRYLRKEALNAPDVNIDTLTKELLNVASCPKDALRRFYTYMMFTMPALIAADKIPNAQIYRWDYETPFFGAAHALELLLLFETTFSESDNIHLGHRLFRGFVFGTDPEKRDKARKAIQSTVIDFARGIDSEPYTKRGLGKILSDKGIVNGPMWTEQQKTVVKMLKDITWNAVRPVGAERVVQRRSKL